MHMHWLFIGVALIAALHSPSLALGDSWAQPKPRIFSSKWGAWGFKVLEPKFLRDSVGELFRLDDNGNEIVVWRERLVNVPHRVFVSNDGQRIVTIDTYGRLGSDHSIVVYDENGKVLLDGGVDKLLNPIESALFVQQSVSSFHWAKHCQFQFVEKQRRFQIAFNWPDDAKARVAEYRKIIPKIQEEDARKMLEHWMREFDNLAKSVHDGRREIFIDLKSGQIMHGVSGIGKKDLKQTPTPDGDRGIENERITDDAANRYCRWLSRFGIGAGKPANGRGDGQRVETARLCAKGIDQSAATTSLLLLQNS